MRISSLVVVFAALAFGSHAGAAVLFSDNFTRPNNGVPMNANTVGGDGWYDSDWGKSPRDWYEGVSIQDNSLQVNGAFNTAWVHTKQFFNPSNGAVTAQFDATEYYKTANCWFGLMYHLQWDGTDQIAIFMTGYYDNIAAWVYNASTGQNSGVIDTGITSGNNEAFSGFKIVWSADSVRMAIDGNKDGTDEYDQTFNIALTKSLPLYFLDTAGGQPTRVDNVVVTQVPEPATLSLLGLAGLAALRRKK